MTTESLEDLFALPDDHRFNPLADKLRPQSLDCFFGQQHILGDDKALTKAILNDQLHSMVFWGPPGTGKTSLAKIIAKHSGAYFYSLSAVLSGVKDIREAVATAKRVKSERGLRTILFIDEVHRFNKSQQDAFLPHVEDGTFLFIGATTENPSFELNNALLSRARVYTLKSLDHDSIIKILKTALQDTEKGLGQKKLNVSESHLHLIAKAADGDARKALNFIETIAAFSEEKQVKEKTILDVISGHTGRFDKGGDIFYEQISALHKSVRGSSPDGALYWFCRMIDGGCAPLYIARRLLRMASEDIGNADPRALQLCLDAWQTQERLGSPEGELALAQAVLYLASAPKSNAVYKAFKAAMVDARSSSSLEVPVHLRNAPTRLMKELGYGHDYRYAHDEPEGYAAGENYFPDNLARPSYYHPVDRGLEIKISQKMRYLKQLDQQFHEEKKRNN